MSDEDRLRKAELDLAKERVLRHMVTVGVDPEYAEFHIAKHGQFERLESGAIKMGDDSPGPASYALELLKNVPTRFLEKDALLDLPRDVAYDAAAAGQAAAAAQKRATSDSSLAFK